MLCWTPRSSVRPRIHQRSYNACLLPMGECIYMRRRSSEPFCPPGQLSRGSGPQGRPSQVILLPPKSSSVQRRKPKKDRTAAGLLTHAPSTPRRQPAAARRQQGRNATKLPPPRARVAPALLQLYGSEWVSSANEVAMPRDPRKVLYQQKQTHIRLLIKGCCFSEAERVEVLP